MPDKQKDEWEYKAERRRRYPGYNMLFVPSLVNCEPLEIFLSLVRLGRAISVLDDEEALARYCAKYYWVGDGVNAYEGKIKRNIREYNASLVHYNLWKTFGEWLLKQTCFEWIGSYSTQEEELECLRELKEEEGKDSESRATHSEAVVDSALRAYGEYADVVATYIERRAWDLFLYGEKVANRTFPLPTLKGATAWQMSEVVDTLAMRLERRREQKEKREQEVQCEKMEEEVYRTGAEWFTKHSITMPVNLHPMRLGEYEREMVIEACEKTLLQNGCGRAKKVIDEFVKICELLGRVENHILVPSGQYVTREVNARAEQDMTNEMARELDPRALESVF